MIQRRLIVTGALLMLTGVAAGAFGAHALKGLVPESMLPIWHTAVLYHLVHGLGLLLVAALNTRASRLMDYAGALMLAGVIIFSGSLYGLVLSNTGWLGAITPIGGLSFILAWALVALAAWRAT